MQRQVKYSNSADKILEKQHNGYSKFIIVSHARSGSNLLLNSLNSHPNLIAEHEIFAAHNRNIGEDFQPTLERLFCPRAKSAKAVGCKIFYYHLNDAEWQQIAEIPNLKVIHLKRKNRLSMIVSMKVAFKTDQWGITNESERIAADEKQVYLDDDFLRDSFTNIESWENKTNQLFQNSQIIDFAYEDLSQHYGETMNRLFDFLAVPQIPIEQIKTKHKRQNPEPLNKLIQNYAELKAKFANTPWEHYFDC